MSKAKAYTKMILERLNKKTEHQKINSNASSNQKTQATPSDNHHLAHNARSFFEHFEKNCAVYHEPVIIYKQRKPLRRPLHFELTEMQHKAATTSYNFQREYRLRMATEPFRVSQFVAQEPRRNENKFPRFQGRELREIKCISSRKNQQRQIRPIHNNQSQQYITRYRSLKTIPSRTITAAEVSSYRRVLVSPTSQLPFERRNSFEKRQKLQRKVVEPKRDLLHRCESFEKYMASRPL